VLFRVLLSLDHCIVGMLEVDECVWMLARSNSCGYVRSVGVVKYGACGERAYFGFGSSLGLGEMTLGGQRLNGFWLKTWGVSW